MQKVTAYPREFPFDSRDRIEAAKLIAKRRFEEAEQREFSDQWDARSSDERAFYYAYILEGFLAFVREACLLAGNENWSIVKVRSAAEDFF